ncbi:SAM-dependent methyltransferase [Paenibacillus sp. PK3_47]|uniref:class I SAM-dependent methyltransferase n=1 Tax=Paenibacillus sp. PK3_47 TaxID=2072642 RepID=UPI00201E4AB7|nr:class I SAM-dependent methyltransferase [Paenibacillus sp. PK3_47]UQZ36885.1 SAM-dependent methyltransferase [Paenibacillus sp. PK3_47]
MPVIEIVAWIAVLAVLLSVLSIVVVSWKNGISPMPSSSAVRQAVAAEVQRITSYGHIIEPGSGWGTLGLAVIRRCPGIRLTGIENSSLPLWCSQLLAFLYPRLFPAVRGKPSLGRLRFKRGDIYSFSYQDADIILCYLFPAAMERLAAKFKRELLPGAVVISVCFSIPGMQPARIITCSDSLRTKVYVYRY